MKLSEIINKYGDCEVKQELIDLIDVKPKTIYDLKCDDEYYIVDCYGSAERREFSNDYYDNVSLSTGNAFLTIHEAEIYLEKLKVEAILRKHSYNFSKEEWNSSDITKYYIEYLYQKKDINIDYTNRYKTQGTIFFSFKKDCQNAIDEVGKQRLINYFNGVL